MEIAPHLIGEIEKGRVILFLGAGASLGAKNLQEESPPTGRQLGEMLCDNFLGGKYKDCPLDHISELAIAQSDLFTVQEFIREKFENFQPTYAHELICTFRWHAIVTTNFDRLIENAYKNNRKAAQKPKPFIGNGDRVEDRLKEKDAVALLKIHGCISRVTDENCPLIITIDQYVNYQEGRERVFSMLKDWAYEHSILFLGYGLADPNVRAILSYIDSKNPSRPRGYCVSPDMDEAHINLLATKRITGIKGTFEEFMSTLDASASKFRAVQLKTARPDLPVFEKFSLKTNLSEITLDFIQNDVQYVKTVRSSQRINPADFYRGMNFAWSAVDQDLDVRRSLSEQVLQENVLAQEVNHLERMEIVLIKAYAGAGKTVMLQRLAWEAAKTYDCFCLYLTRDGTLNPAAIKEIIQNSSERLFIFVDNLGDRIKEIQSLAKNIGVEGKKLTIIAAERINEWNVISDEAGALITHPFELKYLNDTEIDNLLNLLEKNQSLGNLSKSSMEDRREAFRERASRQLLVALHEATFGKPFEDILKDEFDNITPFEAQQIYDTVCCLNRLDIPVRAGIISRLHGVRFEAFEKNFFAPLEHVVKTQYDHSIRDYVYMSRHPHIADIVFSFRNQEEKYTLFMKCLDNLNIDYECDRKAFRQMIQAKGLNDIFTDHELASGVLAKARDIVGDSGNDYVYFLHQSALYEMKRSNGNLRFASDWLSEAIHLAPSDMTLTHSMANLYIQLSETTARTEMQMDNQLNEAIKLGKQIAAVQKNSSHGYHVQARAWLKRLRRVHDNSNIENINAQEMIIVEIERILSNGLQQFPNDPFLRSVESEFAGIMEQSERSVTALESAFAGNPRNTYVALRLADHYKKIDCLEKAQDTLKTALGANPGEKRLHFAFGQLRLEQGDALGDELIYHFKRSFNKGDHFYEARLLYGRQLFIEGQYDESRSIFKDLENQNMNTDLRIEMKYPLSNLFRGRIHFVSISYSWIQLDGTNERIFVSKSNVEPDLWAFLVVGGRVVFRIAFTMRGASAFDLVIE